MINLPESTKNQYKDYNREIKAFGNLYIANKRESENLMPYVNGNQTARGITSKAYNNIFEFEGTFSGVETSIFYDTDFVIPAGTYTVSLNTTGNSRYPNFILRDNNSSIVIEVDGIADNNGVKTYKFDNDVTIKRIQFYVNNSNFNQKYRVMINKGIHKLNFEEYGTIVNDYNSLYEPSKNLFNINGDVNIRGNTGGAENKNSVFGKVLTTNVNSRNEHSVGQKFTNLNGVTFTFSAKVLSNGTGDGARLSIYENNTFKGEKQKSAGNYIEYTYTGTSNNIVLAFTTSGGTGAQFTDIQVERGSSRTYYVPYNELMSKNLFNINNLTLRDAHGTSYINYNSETIVMTDYAHVSYQTLQQLCPSMEAGKSYTLSFSKEPSYYEYIYLKGSQTAWRNGYTRTITSAELNDVVYFYGGEHTTTDVYIMANIQIEEGQGATPYERYNSTPFKLGRSVSYVKEHCEILDFNISAKGDIYYSSLPYNTMTINVNNEEGYFTEEAENNILDKINKDFYVDLFMKINNDKYYKIMSMNFNDVTYADYQKAKLEFYSCIYKINNAKEAYYNIVSNLHRNNFY